MAWGKQEQKVLDAFLEQFQHGVGKVDIKNFIEFADTTFKTDYKSAKQYVLPLSEKVKRSCLNYVRQEAGKKKPSKAIEKASEIYWKVVLMEARNRQLDSYLRYLERKRDPKRKFYVPRAAVFEKHGLTQMLQAMLDDELDICSISLPPGTGKTSAERFFATGVMGWWPDDFSLFYSHSDDIVKKFYDDAIDIVSNDTDYTWGEIFPGLSVTDKDASLKQFNVGKYKPFPSLQCTSVGAKSAGKVRASKFLYVDDMVGKWEEAQNMNILNTLWDNYSVNAVQRKIPGCKEIHIATRWSLYDVIGRIQSHHEDDPRAKFLSVPATYIDPETKEEKSNFEYDVAPMTVEFFHSQQEIMPDAAYDALYDQKPIEKEGRLYDADTLRRYFTLPEAEPDAVVGVCDTKSKGTDFMFLPCVYQYGDDFYLEDCVCDDNTDFGVQENNVVDIIVRNNMQIVQFESNTGGDRFAENVQKRLDKLHNGCSVTTKPTETNKETKIIVNADWVKKHVVFKDISMYKAKSDYGRMMHLLCTYSTLSKGKDVHDDVPDGLAMLALFINQTFRRRQAVVVHGGFNI